MTQGFITIATGDEQYYKLAVNLLHSYRHFSNAPLPFAILADRQNDFTAEFDDVRLFSRAHCGYLDKLDMFDYLPYDVNIFIDADCLAYGDLNSLFDVFRNADDFPALDGFCRGGSRWKRRGASGRFCSTGGRGLQKRPFIASRLPICTQ